VRLRTRLTYFWLSFWAKHASSAAADGQVWARGRARFAGASLATAHELRCASALVNAAEAMVRRRQPHSIMHSSALRLTTDIMSTARAPRSQVSRRWRRSHTP
jgi:hypothetical protein